jgi:hypothetical protein
VTPELEPQRERTALASIAITMDVYGHLFPSGDVVRSWLQPKRPS